MAGGVNNFNIITYLTVHPSMTIPSISIHPSTTIPSVSSGVEQNTGKYSALNVKAIRTLPLSEYSLSSFVKAATIFGKRQGDSYKIIISDFKKILECKGNTKLQAELKLYLSAGKYIVSHPNSRRNTAMGMLRDYLSKDLEKNGKINQYDEVKADLLQCKIKEGTITPLVSDFKVELMPDGSKVLTGKSNALPLLNELQKTMNRKLLVEQLEIGKADGERLKANAGLLDGELGAIQWYTSAGFSYINSLLRESEVLSSFIKDNGINIVKGLNKLESFNGTVYRALAMDDLSSLAEKMSPGQLVADKGFLSTTSSSMFAKSFRGGKSTVIYAIDSVITGRNIAGYTQLKQAEVLLAPGHHMRVTATKLTEQNLYVVLESTNKFIKGEAVRNLALDTYIGIAINDKTTTVTRDVRSSFDDPTIVPILEQLND